MPDAFDKFELEFRETNQKLEFPGIVRAERLVSEAAKMYRFDKPSPSKMQAYLDEASALLSDFLKHS